MIAVVGEVVEEAVGRGEEYHHVANVEVTVNRDGKGENVETELSMLDQLFNTQRQEREPQNCIDPHGVVLLDDRIGGHSVQNGERQNSKAVGFALCVLVEINAHIQAAESRFEQEQEKQPLQHTPLREQNQQHSKRRGNIIIVDA